jgi:RNA-binding protein NOB1
MATDTPKSIHSLVIDAGPIIKNDPPVSTLLGQAEILYTIPAVIDELRDEVTRTRVETTLLQYKDNYGFCAQDWRFGGA